MKLRTSYFNSTAFRKNITRFLPLWTLYTVVLLIALLILTDSNHDYLAREVSETIPAFAIANLVYGFLCATVLFGDLFQPRLCNALHAMPLRREGWFLTSLASGLSFSLAPTALVSAISSLTLLNNPVEQAWLIPWLVFGAANLQFLFFFGVAVLSTFCAGNRLASLLIYGIVNFAAMLVYWMVDTLYLPMLRGVVVDAERFMPYSPVVNLAQLEYLDVSLVYSKDDYYVTGGSFFFVEGWGTLGIYALLGLATLGLSLMLYRRRRLECAGDFLALRPLEPVFLVVYSVVAGCIFQMADSVFGYSSPVYVLLFIGLIIGWFTGKMLLNRNVRVFQKRGILGCIALLAAMIISLGVTSLDPLGIESWVPEPEEVASVGLSHYRYDGDHLILTEPEEVADILAAHAAAIREPGYIREEEMEDGEFRDININLTYTLKNGTVVERQYYPFSHRECAQLLKPYFSSVENIFGMDADLDTLIQHIDTIYLDNRTLEGAQVRELLEAMVKDCQEGTMAQSYGYHPVGDYVYWMSFPVKVETGLADTIMNGEPTYHRSVEVYSDAVHTMKWLADNGCLEEYNIKYGSTSPS